MTLRAISGGESSLTGAISSPAAGSGQIVIREFAVARAVPLPNTRTLESVLASFAGDVAVAAEMPAARQQLARAFGETDHSLPTLRLRAGLSQAQLAVRVGTSQSHIARIERGTNDPTTDVILRISAALGVDAAIGFAAVVSQRELVG